MGSCSDRKNIDFLLVFTAQAASRLPSGILDVFIIFFLGFDRILGGFSDSGWGGADWAYFRPDETIFRVRIACAIFESAPKRQIRPLVGGPPRRAEKMQDPKEF